MHPQKENPKLTHLPSLRRNINFLFFVFSFLYPFLSLSLFECNSMGSTPPLSSCSIECDFFLYSCLWEKGEFWGNQSILFETIFYSASSVFSTKLHSFLFFQHTPTQVQVRILLFSTVWRIPSTTTNVTNVKNKLNLF